MISEDTVSRRAEEAHARCLARDLVEIAQELDRLEEEYKSRLTVCQTSTEGGTMPRGWGVVQEERDYSPVVTRAAKMLGCDWPGVLHYKFITAIREIDQAARGEVSDDVIALLIYVWRLHHPGERLVGE